MNLKGKLKGLLEISLAEEKSFAKEFEVKEINNAGKVDGWLAKDIVAHIVFWKDYFVKNTRAAMRGESTKPCADFNKLNAEVFEVNRDKAWQEVAGELKRVSRSATECLEAIPDEMLLSDAAAWQEKRSLWRIVAGSCYLHPIAHLSDYYSKKGRADYALTLHQQAAALARGLSDSPEWLGVLTYNLACGYALTGKPAKAIEKLGEALEKNPKLADWSMEDPDLTSIRDLEGYKSLVGGKK